MNAFRNCAWNFLEKFAPVIDFFVAGDFHLLRILPKFLYWCGILGFKTTGVYIENPQIIKINYSEHYKKLKMKTVRFSLCHKECSGFEQEGRI